MADTVSDFLLKRLHDWGVRRIYGYPGDGINGVMGALERAGDAAASGPPLIVASKLGVRVNDVPESALVASIACDWST